VVSRADPKTSTKGGENRYGSEKGKEKEEIRTETVTGFLLYPGPLPQAGLFCASCKDAKAQRLAKKNCVVFFAPLREIPLLFQGLFHSFSRPGPADAGLRP
jgi:hypothetical protein